MENLLEGFQRSYVILLFLKTHSHCSEWMGGRVDNVAWITEEVMRSRSILDIVQ